MKAKMLSPRRSEAIGAPSDSAGVVGLKVYTLIRNTSLVESIGTHGVLVDRDWETKK